MMKILGRGLFLAFMVLFFAKANLFSAMFVPDIYVAGSFVNSGGTISNAATKDNLKSSNGSMFALGIRPLDIPIIGGLRVEGQYSKTFGGDLKSDNYGLVFYYDILRIIPIVNPYIGMGYYGSKNDLKSGATTNRSFVSLNAGITASLPIVDLFVEYRVMNQSFGDYFKVPSKKSKTNGVNISKNDILVGVRYYFLK